MTSVEPGESWRWDFRTETAITSGPELAPPTSRPAGQSSPAPTDRVPANWLESSHR